MAQAPSYARLAQLQQDKQSLLCVGLDLDPARMPEGISQTQAGLLTFSENIVQATAPHATAWKINVAFLEVLGALGWKVLEGLVGLIREHSPDALLIADAKRGDIGISSQKYAQAFFGSLNVDAITVAPYMGLDSVAPFLEWPDKWTFVLGATSNPGAQDFQFQDTGQEGPLYKRVIQRFAQHHQEQKQPGVLGFVAGATRPETLFEIAQLAPGAPLLIPGIGAQGGDLEATLKAVYQTDTPLFINATRSVIYASSGSDYAEAAAAEAERLQQSMASCFQ